MKIRLIQNFGKSPDQEPNSGNWIIVKLRVTQEENLNRFFQMVGESFHAWGNYRVTENHGDPSLGIGMMRSPSKLKFWAYNAGELCIYFGTIITGASNVAGGDPGGIAPDSIRREMVLEKAVLLGTKISQFGNSQYNEGQVLMDSWIGPFKTGKIYWEVN